MKKNETIKSKKEFTELITNSKYIKTEPYIIYYKENNLSKKRFGIAISNKIGNAVTRNKLKRQTREIIKNLKTLFPNNQDYIIMIRKGCLNISFNERLEILKKKLKEKTNETKN